MQVHEDQSTVLLRTFTRVVLACTFALCLPPGLGAQPASSAPQAAAASSGKPFVTIPLTLQKGMPLSIESEDSTLASRLGRPNDSAESGDE
jgi:hypothetical protein